MSSPVSAAKPTTTDPGRVRWVAISCRMSGFWVSSRPGAEPSAAFLILLSLIVVGR